MLSILFQIHKNGLGSKRKKGCIYKKGGVKKQCSSFFFLGLGLEPGQGDPAQPTFGKHGWQNPACLIPKNAQTKGEATAKGGMPPDTTAVGRHNMSPPRGRQPQGRRGNANEKKKKNEGDDKCMKTQNECCWTSDLK